MGHRIGVTAFVFGLTATLATGARAQSADGYFSSVVKKPLGEAGTRGQGVFLQRCQICHLPQLPERSAPMGPVLNHVQMATPDAEAKFRTKVLDGSMKMPGFKYTLQQQQVDDLVAYFKAVK